MSIEETISNFYKEIYKAIQDRTNDKIEASNIAECSTLAYVSGRFPKMGVKTFTDIVWQIRKEMWDI